MIRASSPRLPLAHLPTPLLRPGRLADVLGVDLWVKRDDSTGGAEAGNKIRKLEYLLGDALARGADVVITCGGIQSNHARATALSAALLGLRCVLFLRTAEAARGASALPEGGNVLLDRMAGAEIRLVSPEVYRDREAVMAEAAERLAREGQRPYVIPEGGSNGIGALGYVRAMEEVRRQLDLGLGGGRPFDVVVHACGSGGTAAGLWLGAAAFGVAAEVRPMAVCDDAAFFEAAIARIAGECEPLLDRPGPRARLKVDDGARGPAYAEASPDQLERIVRAARLSGLVFDPVYTGKAFSGLWEACERGELRGARVLFLHTGGLPGLLAQGGVLSACV